MTEPCVADSLLKIAQKYANKVEKYERIIEDLENKKKISDADIAVLTSTTYTLAAGVFSLAGGILKNILCQDPNPDPGHEVSASLSDLYNFANTIDDISNYSGSGEGGGGRFAWMDVIFRQVIPFDSTIMAVELRDGLGAPTGCRFMKKQNQLAFVEYSKGRISLLDMVRSVKDVSHGTTVIKGTWSFDCEKGTMVNSFAGDIWWEQIDSVKRQIVPINGASILNLGTVDFNSVTPLFLQALTYSESPIVGNNDASNKLVNNDVFAIQTSAGNYTKIRVAQYGYDLKIEWMTYKLNDPYHPIGSGYSAPEDIAVCSDERTAYVTERTGNLLKIDLISSANRFAAIVIASGMKAPQQIFLDESHQQVYVVEYANPGRLIRIDLKSGQQTTLLKNLNNAVGLLISQDLAYAYISEQSGGGSISRYSLKNETRVEIASGLINPFFLTWANPEQSAIFVAERDPGNNITLVSTLPNGGRARHIVSGTGMSPSCVAQVDATRLLISCDQEIDLANILESTWPTGILKGIGLVPWNLINSEGKADTTTQADYLYQFPKDSPFGGVLSLQIDHIFAWQNGVEYYRVIIDNDNNNPRQDTWSDLKLNQTTGKFDILVPFYPKTFFGQKGCYNIHQPDEWFMNTDLGMRLDSTTLSNGNHSFRVEFINHYGKLLGYQMLSVFIDNNKCRASLEIPIIAGKPANNPCGITKFTDTSNVLSIAYMVSHPLSSATYSFWIVRGANTIRTSSGIADPVLRSFEDKVGNLLGTCPNAAFSVGVHVYAKAINGYSRLSMYDASSVISFALTS